jgi:XRE family transcriptional regulator, regulator of sulfur utilization
MITKPNDTALLKKIGENIEHFRLLRKKTITDMASSIHLSNSGYRNIERGITELSIRKLFQIAFILNTGVIQLLGPDNIPDPKSILNQDIIENLKNTIKHYNEEILFLRKQIELMAGNR